MPCTHIYCVLDDINYIQPDLFHIRWWKHFNYMFRVSDDYNYDISKQKIGQTLEEIINKSLQHK